MESNTSQQNQEMADQAALQANESVDPSVIFINDQVLNAKAEPFTGSAKLIADQAAAMMLQDVRGFMQGSQQIYMLATAKAISKTLSQDPTVRAAGTEALTQIFRTQTELTKFSANVGTIAGKITHDFNDSDAGFEDLEKLYQAAEIVEDIQEDTSEQTNPNQ
jgi:hypothetical protein